MLLGLTWQVIVTITNIFSLIAVIFFFTLSIYYGQEEPFMATLIGLYSNLSVVRSGDISLIHLSKFGCMFLSYLETKALM